MDDDSDDDGAQLYEMMGTLTEWDGTSGCVISDCGERLVIHRLALKVFGFEQPIEVGDRISFLASKRAQISYSLRDISNDRTAGAERNGSDAIAQSQSCG